MKGRKQVAAVLAGWERPDQRGAVAATKKPQNPAPPDRALEVLDELLREAEADAAIELEDLLRQAWIRCIAEMTPGEVKELAAGTSLTDQQAEAIVRRAKEQVEFWVANGPPG